jgi:CRP-like cAMP-binding protein
MVRNLTLAAMGDDDLAALLPDLSLQTVSRGSMLIVQGVEVDTLYFPATAYLANLVTFQDGGRAMSFVMGAEGVSGLAPFMADEASAWGVQVRAAGEVYSLPAAALRKRMEDSADLRRQLGKLSYGYQVQAAYAGGCAALHDSRGRLATLILRSSERLGASELRLTQQDIGEFLGLQRTTVNSAALGLRAAGAIRYLRGVIRIADRDALMKNACECYRLR